MLLFCSHRKNLQLLLHLFCFLIPRNNSETVQVVILAFSSDHQHFIRDIRTKFGVPNSPQSPGIGQNTDGCITDLRISGQSYYKRKLS